MGLFGKKKEAPVDETKVGALVNSAKGRLVGFADDALTKAYKQKRLIFSDDSVIYTDASGKTFTYSGADCIDQFSMYMFNRLNSQLSGRSMFGVQPNMVMVGVTVNDIHSIVMRLKGG